MSHSPSVCGSHGLGIPRVQAHVSSLAFAMLCVVVAGCSQAAPSPGPSSSGTPPPAPFESSDAEPMAGENYFPLDAASWTYRHSDAAGGGWDETVSSAVTEMDGVLAFRMDENENLAGERGETLHVRREGRVLRVHQDVFQSGVLAFGVDYDPGFLRWDDAWLSAQTMDWTYTRTETDAVGVQNVATRLFHYTIVSIAESVTVPAGTFDTVHVQRVRDDTLETNEYWFAAGVGKVKEVNVTSGGIEELTAYEVP